MNRKAASAPAGRAVVAVVGMHRSGTSLTMQALGALGLTSGDGMLAANAYNPRGYWEAAEIVALNDRLLAALERPWGSFPHMLPLPDGWQDSAAARHAEAEIEEVLETRLAKAEGRVLAIKDPRLSLFLPLWQRVADDLAISWKTVLCLRNPWDVAQSLLRRDSIPTRAGEALWLLYTASVLANARPETTLLSRFDDWTTAPDAALARLAAFTGQPLPDGASAVFEPGLVTVTPPVGDALVQSWVHALEAARAPATGGVDLTPALQDRARSHLAHARHFEIWPDTLRDAGLASDLSKALVRTLDSMTADRDAQAARSRDLQTAYQTEAARAEALRTALTQTEAARDAQAARALELQTAYQTEAARAEALRSALTEAEAARDAQTNRALELQTAYQTEAARAAELAARLARLDPRTWFGSKRG